MRQIYFFNSLTRKKEEFKPNQQGKVSLYTCGPTVYDRVHIGNLLAYTVWDVLKRFLRSQGYTVKHIMNLTDVGHLVSDSDQGDDKLDKASKKEGRTAWEIADNYINFFKRDIKAINILPPTKYIRATDTIKEQIAFTKILDKKGYLYEISDGMYFDTSKVPDYGKISKLAEVEQIEGARVEKNKEKRNPNDFAVWKFSPEDSKRDMEWESPWGKGFPGWHLECSVMSRMELGDNFDIHTGGMDHLTVHHPNEMAQSYGVTGKLQANIWLHNAFLKFDSGKMSKSAGTFTTIKDIEEKRINPIAFRYLVLQNHYRKPLNFTWDSLQAAQSALKNIIREIAFFDKPKIGCAELEDEFYGALADDLNTSKALAVLQKTIATDAYPTAAKLQSILKMDEVLGLGLDKMRKDALNISLAAKKLLDERKTARENKDFAKADEIRERLAKMDVELQDTSEGQKAIKL